MARIRMLPRWGDIAAAVIVVVGAIAVLVAYSEFPVAMMVGARQAPDWDCVAVPKSEPICFKRPADKRPADETAPTDASDDSRQ